MTELSVPFTTVLQNSLRDPAHAQAYLDVAVQEYQEDGDLGFFLAALRNVAEAHGGLSALAEKTRLNRQNLYKALSPKGNPKIDTLGAILHGMGLRLSVQTLAPGVAHS
ncbi:MAG: addiction module antidote protein [Holosporales bacterium]|jgi:probable addiction module antidote protein